MDKAELQTLLSFLSKSYKRDNKSFQIDELRVTNNRISVWDINLNTWLYLNEDLEWVSEYDYFSIK